MRATRKKSKPGQLLMFYGKLPGEDPDIIISLGEGCSRRDGKFLHALLCAKRPAPFWSKEQAFEPSFVNSLEFLGYDITTLKFSIEKKPVEAMEVSDGKG